LTVVPYLGQNPRYEMEGHDAIDRRLAERLRALRTERAWSLEALAERSGVSRATLSRIENAEVSPTLSVLGRLCGAFELSMSRLIQQAEGDFGAHVPRAAQAVWRDEAAGFVRRTVSPPDPLLAGEVLECALGPGADIAYERSPRPGLEHHLVLLEGALEVTVEGRAHALQPGDALRYRLTGGSVFRTPAHRGARYYLFLV
jgi:transcriptional regulator with XRE-family HTH domain